MVCQRSANSSRLSLADSSERLRREPGDRSPPEHDIGSAKSAGRGVTVVPATGRCRNSVTGLLGRKTVHFLASYATFCIAHTRAETRRSVRAR